MKSFQILSRRHLRHRDDSPRVRQRLHRRAATILLLAAISGATASACSSLWWRPRVLLASNAELLSARRPSFDYEIRRALIKQPVASSPREYSPWWMYDTAQQRSTRIDVAEVRQAMHDLDTGLPEQTINVVVQEYSAARTEVGERSSQRESDREKGVTQKTWKEAVPVPQSVPRQFALYLEGYGAYVDGNDVLCQKKLTELLDLPLEQRRMRSVWANYILGRSYSRTDAAKAMKSFEQTRTLAAQGLSDPLDLATESLGSQARAALDSNDPLAAFRLYAQGYKAGAFATSTSMQVACTKLATASNETLQLLANDPELAKVFTAWILSAGGDVWDEKKYPRPTKKLAERWFDAIATTHTVNAENVDRLAWAAYLAGRYDLARSWIQLGNPDSAVILWVNSRLALRDGKIDEAMGFISRAIRQFPVDQDLDPVWPNYSDDAEYRAIRRASGELAALHLSRGQYAESLALLASNDYADDAYYVAERVLTVEELIAYVDQHPLTTTPPRPQSSYAEPRNLDVLIRELLARRLVRLGQWKTARPYFSTAMQTQLDKLIDHLQKGNDTARSPADRATDLWAAAKVMINGEGLMSPFTELPPSRLAERDRSSSLMQERATRARMDWLITPGTDELKRVAVPLENVFRPDDYRYIAGDLAYAAAELLPDNSDQAAEILLRAGVWFRNKQPIAADRFYKALVRRCPETKVGALAKKNGWLPSN